MRLVGFVVAELTFSFFFTFLPYINEAWTLRSLAVMALGGIVALWRRFSMESMAYNGTGLQFEDLGRLLRASKC